MSEMKFTPWALDGNEKSWSLLDRQGRRIALIDKGGLDAAANARLIAAAPELLEALHQARGWLESWASAEEQLATINAAIAKAEGSQP